MTKKTKVRRDIHQEITDKIVAELEAGSVPWLQPWAAGRPVYRGFHRNFVSKREYNGVNTLILWIAQKHGGYQSYEWLTYNQAKAKGGNVRKGEKGTEIVFWQITEKEVPNKDTGVLEKKKIFFLKWFVVFNVEQCDGLNVPVLPAIVQPKNVDGLTPEFQAAVKATGIEIKHGGDEAYYKPFRDYIQLPKLENFKSAANYEATQAHELIHATGHPSRLNRKIQNTFGDSDYAFEELVAEIGAAFTCAEFGIQGELRHAGYIASWIKYLKDNPKAIVSAASKASAAVKFLYPKADETVLEEAA